MARARAYISGPITAGDRNHNFAQAAEAHTKLLLAGIAPLNPMLSMALPGAFDIPHHIWIAADLPWVEVAEAVLRLPGESKGADIECQFAEELGIPVFTDIEALVGHFALRPAA